MKITRTSLFTGLTRTIDLPITQEQYDSWKDDGLMVQEAFPNLTADEREFLLTGAWGSEWDEFTKEYDNEAV